MAEYDGKFGNVQEFFGSAPDSLLTRFYRWIDLACPVLDIGSGQGRHALFLARKGFQVDAIDPSAVAIQTVSKLAAKEQLRIRAYQCGFDSFAPETEVYSGILAFGVLQVLSWGAISLLAQRIDEWAAGGTIILVTAFTTEDPSFSSCEREWKKIGKNSFQGPGGKVRTFLEQGEIADVLMGYRLLHHWEGIGPEHRHGDDPPHRHGRVEAVFEKQEPMPA